MKFAKEVMGTERAMAGSALERAQDYVDFMTPGKVPGLAREVTELTYQLRGIGGGP